MASLLSKPLGLIAPKDFKRKFAAWWEGVEYRPPVSDTATDVDAEGNAALAHIPETLLAMAFAQGLWGEGYLGPGTADHYIDLVKGLSLTHDKSLAILGIGLAGPARDIVRETDVWISGYEARATAIEEANAQCTKAGMAKKIVISSYDPEKPDLPEAKFDSIVSFEELCFVHNKARLIDVVANALKHKGSVLITDYLALSDDLDDEALKSLFGTAWGTPHLWTSDLYKAAFEEAGLSPRVDENLTTHYVQMIEKGWSRWRRVLDTLQSKDMSSGLQAAVLRALGDQAAIWANRLEAMNSGKIAIHRLLAIKPSAPVR